MSEREQLFDQRLHVVDLVDDKVDGFTHRRRILRASAFEDLEMTTRDGEWRPQLMRDVRKQSPLRGHRRGELVGHDIERRGEPTDLVRIMRIMQPTIHCTGGDVACSVGDPRDAVQQSAQHEIAAGNRRSQRDDRLANCQVANPT